MDWGRVGNVGRNRKVGRIGWGVGADNTSGLLDAVEQCFT